MKLPVIDRFQKQNYPNSADWFTRFLGDINQFTETVWNILNKNLTLTDNIDSQVFSFSILAGPTAADNVTSFTATIKHSPVAVIVGQATDQAAYSGPLSSAVFVTWTFSGQMISITGISGLVDTHTYSITLVVL